MKTSCRILVGLGCNYQCNGCCNTIPGILDSFQYADIGSLPLENYEDICISGGEPLMVRYLYSTTMIATRAKALGKKVYIYTNLSFLPPKFLVDLVDGWSVGFHPDQVLAPNFRDQVSALLAMSPKGVRVHVEDCETHRLDGYVHQGLIKTWVRNECDKTDKEDGFILRSYG